MSTIERIKLYHYPATRSARVKWMLHEVLEDDFDVERVDLYAAEQYEASYRELNPNHAVPVLEFTLSSGETRRMFESGAMLAWLADAFPDKQLAPPPNGLCLERAEYLQMLAFGSTSMDMMLWQLRAHKHVLAASSRDPLTVERYLAKFRSEVEPQLVKRLSRAPFVCGERFTAADIAVGHCMLWSRAYGLSTAPEFDAYAGRLMERPAFLKAFADLGEFKHEAPESLGDLFTG